MSIGSQTSLYSGPKLHSLSAIRANDSIISANTSTLLSQADNKATNPIASSITVWQADYISPASYLHGHKANAALQWNPRCTTRVSPSNDYVEVLVHQDDSVF